MLRFFRLLSAWLLLPLVWAVLRATLDLLPLTMTGRDGWCSPTALALGAGYLCWALIFAFLSPPAKAYIWAHELTHAAWGLLSGERVGAIHVGETGGSVQLSRGGTLTLLAPYFVPLYTLLLILVRLLAGLFWHVGPRGQLIWLFLVGLTWSFHLSFTIRSLGQRQPDIVACGRLFAYTLIVLLNVAGIGVWMVAATPATGSDYGSRLLQRVPESYQVAWQGLRGGAERISRLTDSIHRLIREQPDGMPQQ